MKKESLFIISLAAMLLMACNGIETGGIDDDTVITKHKTSLIRDINVTQNEAIGIANMFARSNAGSNISQTKGAFSSTKMISSSETIREDGQNLMYVFNYEGGGFVIVGSTRNYYPILAYSDEGSFVLQEDMGPVDVWLDETKVSIKNSGSLDNETKAQMQNLWERYDGTFVDPAQELLAARRPQTRSAGEDSCWAEIERLQAQYGSEGWTFLPLSFVEDLFDDLGLYNEYANICYYATQNHSALNETVIGYRNPVHHIVNPLIGTEWFQRKAFGRLCPYKVAGCGAVAAGQVMFYYKYPMSMTWKNDTFGWDKIPKNHTYDTTQRQSHLMRMLGQKFQMNYRPDSTSATNVTNIVNGLDSLGYYASSSSHNTWTVRNSLYVNRRPVIMFGAETTNTNDDGHFWVCEGVHEIIYDAIEFYTEHQPNSSGTYTQGMYSYNTPGIEGGSIFYHYFYMNWGAGRNTDPNATYNGWFASNDEEYEEGNPQYLRTNIYVSVP